MAQPHSTSGSPWGQQVSAGDGAAQHKHAKPGQPTKETFTGFVVFADRIVGHFQMDVLHIPKVRGKRQFNLNTWTWVDLAQPGLSVSGMYMANLVGSGEVIKDRLALVGVRLEENPLA